MNARNYGKEVTVVLDAGITATDWMHTGGTFRLKATPHIFKAIPHNSKCGDAQEFFRQTIQRIRTVASQLWQGTAPIKDFS